MVINSPNKQELTDYIELIRSWRISFGEQTPYFQQTNLLTFPLKEILQHFHDNGKHFAHPLLLEELKAVQILLSQMEINNESSTYTKLILALLHVLLDKYNNTYHYFTYIALPVIELSQQFNHNQFDKCLYAQMKLISAFVCDLLRFELKTLLKLEMHFQLDMLPTQQLNQRIYYCMRALHIFSSYIRPLMLPENMHELIEAWHQESLEVNPPNQQLALQTLTFSEELLELLSGQMNQLMLLTIFPVHISHDEYMFIRMLQAFEMIFFILAEGLQLCIQAVSDHKFQHAADTVMKLNEVFRLSPALFRILNTMTSEHFTKFRDLTEGSSAIQSVQFKRIEIYSAHPDKQRYCTSAFKSVPLVEREYEQDSFRNLEDFIAPMLDQVENIRNNSFNTLLETMNTLDDSFVNWKKIHYRIAKNMIGKAKGTGNTSGPPYLKYYLEQRLFPFLHPTI